MDAQRYCKTCRFFDGEYCRRNPPEIIGTAPTGRWPETVEYNWCGEWKEINQ